MTKEELLLKIRQVQNVLALTKKATVTIDGIKKTITKSRIRWIYKEVYCPDCGCVMPDRIPVYPSIRYNQLPLVGPNGLKYATSLGLEFYVRTRTLDNNIWISEQDNPANPSNKKTPHVVERWFGFESMAALNKRHTNIDEGSDKYMDASRDEITSQEEIDLWEAKYGIKPEIEDPITGERRLLKLGDVYQFIIPTDHKKDLLDEISEFYGEEPKDPRYDRREDDWKRQQRASGLERSLSEGDTVFCMADNGRCYEQHIPSANVAKPEEGTEVEYQPWLCATFAYNKLLRMKAQAWPSIREVIDDENLAFEKAHAIAHHQLTLSQKLRLNESRLRAMRLKDKPKKEDNSPLVLPPKKKPTKYYYTWDNHRKIFIPVPKE